MYNWPFPFFTCKGFTALRQGLSEYLDQFGNMLVDFFCWELDFKLNMKLAKLELNYYEDNKQEQTVRLSVLVCVRADLTDLKDLAATKVECCV